MRPVAQDQEINSPTKKVAISTYSIDRLCNWTQTVLLGCVFNLAESKTNLNEVVTLMCTALKVTLFSNSDHD